jgi:hypothetical protein
LGEELRPELECQMLSQFLTTSATAAQSSFLVWLICILAYVFPCEKAASKNTRVLLVPDSSSPKNSHIIAGHVFICGASLC